MTPRPRKKGNKDLPLNLYAKSKGGKTYYEYRDPRNGKHHGLGTDKKQAIIDANQLNAVIYSEARKRKIKTIAANTDSILFSAWLARYLNLITARNLKPSTMRTRVYIVNQLDAVLGSILIREITVKHCSDVIARYLEEKKERMAQSVRSVLIDIFKEALAEGEADTNPASKTRAPKVRVKRARLVIDEFKQINKQAESKRNPWMANSQLLALVTGQDRIDISVALKKKPRNWDNLYKQYLKERVDGLNPVIPPSFVDGEYYYATRRKTGALIKIPLSLRLDAVDLSVGDVINRCNDNVFSKYILHHARRTNLSKPGDPIHEDTLTRKFAAAREKTGLTWSGNPPTFKEIRSLSERLYRKQGVNTKDLLGHKEESTTAIYNEARGAEWKEVK